MAQQIRQRHDGGHEGFFAGKWRPVRQDPTTGRWHIYGPNPRTGTEMWLPWADGTAEDLDRMWKEQSPGMPIGTGGINLSAGPPELSWTGPNLGLGRSSQPQSAVDRTPPLGGSSAYAQGSPDPVGNVATGGAGGSWWNRGLDFLGDNWLDVAKLGLGLYGAYGDAKQQQAAAARDDRLEQRTAEQIARSNAIRDAVLANARAMESAAGTPRRYEYTAPEVPMARSAPPTPPRVETPEPPRLTPPGIWRDRNARRS